MYYEKTLISDAILAQARREQSELFRAFFTSLGNKLLKGIPERLRRAYQRRRTMIALERLDERTLADIGLAPGMIRRAAISAADFAYDQEMRGVSKPTFLTPAQAMNQADGSAAKRVANSNRQKKAA